MKNIKPKDSLKEFERTVQAQAETPYELRLFVTGSTPNSLRAVHNLKRICDSHLQGKYTLEVIDLYQKPEAAKEFNIVAAPTLIKLKPAPMKKLLGDLSNEARVLEAMYA